MDNNTSNIKEKDRLDLYAEEVAHWEDLIEKALALWYDIIGGEHHKDRDCHFYIEREYSTYRTATWTVYHNGYILKDHKEEFPSFEQALRGLLTFLLEKIAEEISLTIKHFDDLVKEGERKEEDRELFNKYMKRLEIIVVSQFYDIEKEEAELS
jgi:predicted glutamine amidotransferase